MNAEDMAMELAEKYAGRDTDSDYDWLTIDPEKRQRFSLTLIREQKLELDLFADDAGITALNIILDIIVYGYSPHNGVSLIQAMLTDYQPAIDLFERKREEYLLDSSFVGEPDWDKRLDERF